MNKKVILIAVILILLILLLIGGYFLVKGRTASPVTLLPFQKQTTDTISLKDLISKGIAQSCTFSSTESSGTVYVNEGKVRTDFDTTIYGKATKSHMIVDGNTSYIWSDGSNGGIKMAFDASKTSPSGSGTNTPPGNFDANANMNYKCAVWKVDSSFFVLPAGIEFTSLLTNPAPGSNSTVCASCDSLTGDNKAKCRTAMKCN